jgi:tRNA A-37 threonylcarbamoyl transferase component Bud32
MDDFVASLDAFTRREASLDQLLTLIDRLVAEEGGSGERLLRIVQSEPWLSTLTSDVQLALEQRILHAERGGVAVPMGSASPFPSAPLQPQGVSGRSSVSRQTADAQDDWTQISPPVTGEPKVGDVIKGRFELIEALGAGGMGTVFKAVDRVRVEAHDREPYVAIKTLSSAFRRHEISAVALQRETKKALSLSHPNIVRVYDFDRDGQTMFMTMEYLSGQSLDQLIHAPDVNGFSLERALAIIRPVAAALAYAHDTGLVHSDFKPSNVFVTGTGIVKVIDFGIARAVSQSGESRDEKTVFDPSALGALTPRYASPDQSDGLAPDPRDDIYALACVTYELLTGNHPFDGESGAKARARKMQPKRARGIDRRQWHGLHRALAFDRDVRTRTVDAFMHELTAGSGTFGGRWPVLAGGAALAAAAGAVWFFLPHLTSLSPTVDVERAEPPVSVEQPATPRPMAESPAAETGNGPGLAPEETRETDAEPPTDVARIEPEPPDVAIAVPVGERAAAAVAGLPCSMLHVTDAGGLIDVRGVSGRMAEVAALSDEIGALGGSTAVDTTAVTPLHEFQCRPLDLARPFVSANLDAALGFVVRPEQPVFIGGEKLKVDVVAPHRSAYVYVDYYDIEGGVLHLLPRPNAEDNFRPGGSSLRLGDGGASGQWTIGPPFGDDLIVAFAVSDPLPIPIRPEYETSSGEYLQMLENALADLTRRLGPDAIAADVAVAATRAP